MMSAGPEVISQKSDASAELQVMVIVFHFPFFSGILRFHIR